MEHGHIVVVGADPEAANRTATQVERLLEGRVAIASTSVSGTLERLLDGTAPDGMVVAGDAPDPMDSAALLECVRALAPTLPVVILEQGSADGDRGAGSGSGHRGGRETGLRADGEAEAHAGADAGARTRVGTAADPDRGTGTEAGSIDRGMDDATGIEDPTVWGSGVGDRLIARVSTNGSGGTPPYETIVEALERLWHARDRAGEAKPWRAEVAFDRSPDPMVVLDGTGTIRAANGAARALLGDGGRAPVEGSSFGELVDGGLDFDEHWREFCRDGRDRGILQLTGPADRTRQVEYAAALEVRPGRHLLSLRDVTDRVRSERALGILHEATRELLAADDREAACRTAVAVAEDDLEVGVVGIWLAEPDEDGRSLGPCALSAGAEARFGGLPPALPEDDGIVWEAFREVDIRIFDGSEDEGLLGGLAGIRSEMLVTLGDHGVLAVGSADDGLFDWTTVRLTQLLAGTTAAALDSVTREAELVRRTAALERQNERLDAVAGMLSHDLRNPLTVATGHLELAAREAAPTEREALQTVGQALDRMDELISDVLSMARQGKAVLDSEPVRLEPLLRMAWRTTGDPDRGRLVIEGAGEDEGEGGGAGAGDLGTIEADESRLRTLLENLLGNAREHAGPDPTVRVGPLDGGGFYVADDGDGIPADEREAVFEYGYSSDRRGTGIGLSIVESIAEAHGWSVEVAESATGGARFEVRTG